MREALADLHIRNGNGERAVSMWLHALAECPNNAEVFYHCCTFLMAQVSRAPGRLKRVWSSAAATVIHDHVESGLEQSEVSVLSAGEVQRHPSALQRLHPEPV